METINKKKYLIIFLAIVAIFLIFLAIHQKLPSNGPRIKIGDTTINVEIAATTEAQEKGLSGRSGLGENEGMLFVFDYPGKYYFWMKDMNFPIDMIWVDQDLKVIYIKKSALPESYPESFVSESDAKYVLEVISRFSEKHNLQIGDHIQFL